MLATKVTTKQRLVQSLVSQSCVSLNQIIAEPCNAWLVTRRSA